MDQEQINKNFFERLEKLEKVIFKIGSGKNVKKVTGQRAKMIDLKTPITELYDGGFFNNEKTDNDVMKKLRERVLSSTPKRASVSNTLRGLVKRGFLKRNGEGNKKNPWKYQRNKS